MKNYGMNKATEFTKKQISVIYGCAKRGELKVEKWIMSNMYNLADFYGYDDNGSVASEEAEIKNIIEAVFSKNMEQAQERINSYTENLFGKLTEKRQTKADRNMVS